MGKLTLKYQDYLGSISKNFVYSFRYESTNLVKPGCNSQCGDLIVPYPFGVGNDSKCYIDEGFRIYCNTSLNPPKASINLGGYTQGRSQDL